MRACDGHGGGSEEAVGGIVVAGGAFLLVLGGVYQATQADQATEATPYIAGVVAIIVALVTWYATDRRQSKALAAEQDRLERTLRHEERQDFRNELRQVFDATSTALADFNEAWTTLQDAATRGVGLPSGQSAIDAKREELVDAIWKSLRALDAARYRLTLRLGPGHNASKALNEFRTGITESLIQFRIDTSTSER